MCLINNHLKLPDLELASHLFYQIPPAGSMMGYEHLLGGFPYVWLLIAHPGGKAYTKQALFSLIRARERYISLSRWLPRVTPGVGEHHVLSLLQTHCHS